MRKGFSRKVSTVQQTVILVLLGVVLLHAAPSDYQQNKADQTRQSSARIDPVTLALNIEILLGGYPGRGGTSIPLSISYSSKLWSTNTTVGFQSPGGCNNPRSPCPGVNIPELTQAVFANTSIAGWTSSLKVPKIIFTGKSQMFNPIDGSPSCWECGGSRIPRIHAYLPNGSTHELRRSDSVVVNDDWTGIYYSVDGSQMRYDTETKTLFLPDGSRYIITGAPAANDTGYFDTLSERMKNNYYLTQPADYIDINGNKLSYNPTTKQWTDTLGRAFGSPLPPDIISPSSFSHTPNNPAEGDITYAMPGFGTGTMSYTLKWKKLQYVFSNSNSQVSYQLNYPGNRHRAENPNANPNSPALFANTVSMQSPFNPVVLAEVVLPDGSSYKFGYNPFGEVDKLTHPTGAYEKFTYSAVVPLDQQYAQSTFGEDLYLNRGVTQHRVSAKGDGTDEIVTQYAASYASTTYPFVLPFKSTVTNPDGTVTERLVHANFDPYTNAVQFGFDNPLAGKVYDERLLRGATVLRRSLTDWTTTGAMTGGWSTAKRNPRVTRQTEILFEGGQSLAKTTKFTHDGYQNVTSTEEYDFVVLNPDTAKDIAIENISVGTKRRTTEIDYKTDTTLDAAYLAQQMTDLPKETRIKNASGQVVAKSQVFYDETNYPLLTYSGTIAQWQDPNNAARGNATTTRNYTDIDTNQYIDAHTQYDQFGNLRYGWDAKGNLSQAEYSATYSYAYATKSISPKPDANGVNGSASEFETTTVYDFKTGLPTQATDANNQTTQMSYADPMSSVLDPLLRLRKVTAPNGHQTITEYGVPDGNGQLNAAQRFVKVKTQIDETNWKQGYLWADGLGRTIKTQSIDSNDDVFTLTCYDSLGRLEKVSNPFRTITDPTCAMNLEWTTNTYDDLGRVTKVKTPDNAEVVTAYSLGTGTTIGATLTVTDQAGKQRRSITNGLGQLVRVDEPNEPNAGNSLGTIDNPTQPTNYTYDTLSNLTQVQQIGSNTLQCAGTLTSCTQTRTFVYDALSRLKSATNPEAGLIQYQYDDNGNLIQKTDARGVQTSYAYDAINRVKTRTYANEPSGQIVTPPVTYFYDNITNAKGKLTKVVTDSLTTPFSVTEYQAFDAMGRVTQSEQRTDGTNPGAMNYVYNLSGALIEQKYPSGRVVKNILDADGDLSAVQSKKTQSAGYWTYAKNFTYTAAGAVSSMQLGNGRWESTSFNSRLQPTQIALGSTQNATDKLKLNFNYGTTNNNGNVLSQTITVPTETRNNQTYNGFVATQNYVYDSLNRLSQAGETIAPNVTNWTQTFKYDRYGNRRFNTDVVGYTTTISANCQTSVCNPTIDPSNNRLIGYTFDNAGNTKVDAEGRTFTYDAENKQTKVVNSQQQIVGEYFYDGDGKRVKKVANNETTILLYDAAGKLVAEYASQTSGTAQVSYLTSDHLGSPRINTDANGAVTARHDYQPFGEEIARTGYGADNVKKNFTAYERDNETDLDFAQARMFGSDLGRFTSPDPTMVSASLENPQTWNRYIYVLNNPLKYSDPFGLWELDRTATVENETTTKKGKTKTRVKSVTVLLKKQEGDDVKSLAKQLNISVKSAQKILDGKGVADKDGNLRLSKADGTIGQVFGAIENRIKDHEQDKLENPSKKDDQGFDCSKTTALIAGFSIFDSDAQFSGANGLDESYVGQGPTGATRNVKETDLKAGDMVRFAPDGKVATHWATFLIFNKGGEPVVFSKSGIVGPNEFVTTKVLSGYGSVTPNPNNSSAGTGYYRKVN